MKKIKYRMSLAFIFKAFWVTCIISKAYKKTKKIYFSFFFYYKNHKQILLRITRKISKSFWRRKRQGKKDPRKRSNFNWRRKRKKA